MIIPSQNTAFMLTPALKQMSLILDIHMMFNWQLSHQNIRWPVSRDHIAGSGLELIKVVCFFLSWPLTKCWFSIGSRVHVRLTCWKQGRIVRMPVNANPSLTFSSIQMFLLLCFVYMVIVSICNRMGPRQLRINFTSIFKVFTKVARVAKPRGQFGKLWKYKWN